MAIERLKDKKGFKDHPEGFLIAECRLDQDGWTDGFATMITILVKGKDDTWITVGAECLPNNHYQIVEPYENELLGEFKHLDIVECEEKDNELIAARLVTESRQTD